MSRSRIAACFTLTAMLACEERVASPASVADVVVTPDAANIRVGAEEEFNARVLDGSGNELSRQVSWSVANSQLATVDGSGLVRGVAPGETQVIARVEGREGAATIRVTSTTPASIQISPAEPTVLLGGTTTLTAVVLATDGGTLTDRVPVWTSADQNIASVDAQGVVTGVRIGSTTIVATVDAVTAEVTIVVRAPELAALEIRPANLALEVGDTSRLSAVGRTPGGAEVPGLPIAWSSESAAVANVDAAGLVGAVAVGETRIRAQFGTVSASIPVVVRAVPAATITVEPRTASVQTNDTTRLRATARGANGQILVKTFTWSSHNAGVASVDPGGLVRGGNAAGTVFIVATVDGVRDSAQIQVTARPVARVLVQPSGDTIATGQQTQLTARLEADNGAVLERPVTWSTANAAVATVSSTGLVTGVAIGEAAITATSEGQTGSATIRVEAPAVASVVVSPASLDLVVADTSRLTLVGRDAGGAVVPGLTVAWRSLAAGVATVDAGGLVRGVAAGTTFVVGQVGTLEDSASVVVTAAAPTVGSVSVAPDPVSVAAGDTTRLTATVHDTDGNEMTATVTWSSSSAAVATVNTSGLVTGVAAGTAFIRAVVGDVSDSAAVTVTAPSSSVSRVEVVPDSANLSSGQRLQLEARLFDAGGNPLSGREVDWNSSNTSVAQVNGNGRVTARTVLLPQTVTITATSEGVSGTARIRVTLLAPSPVPDPPEDG
jgi:uncharacterized protein YjdB